MTKKGRQKFWRIEVNFSENVLGKFFHRLLLHVFLKQGGCFIGPGGVDAPA